MEEEVRSTCKAAPLVLGRWLGGAMQSVAAAEYWMFSQLAG